MSIHVALTHRTTYRFDRRVTLSPHVVRLRPAPHCRTPIESYALNVRPDDHFLNWQQDPFGNWLARLVFLEPTTELDIDVSLVADMTVINPFDFFLEEDAEHWPFTYDAQLAHELSPYLDPVGDRLSAGDRTGTGRLFDAFLAEVPSERVRTIDFLSAVNRKVGDEVAYTVRMEAGVQTPEETLAKAVGSCRDSGWLLVRLLRRLGIAARFVSGYLIQLTADEPALDGPSGPTADFTDLHAWAEAFLPGAGWVGLDPTSGLFAGEGHLPLAATPQPSSAAPVTGATSPCEVELEFSNVVRRIRETPRVTLPYTDEQWAAIDALGHAVDVHLRSGDVRLTVGGEPTFVSVDDRESDEWKVAADGPDKRARATDLAGRLRDAFAPGGLLQQTPGKWYPGEPLPRWQVDVLWRTDGQPVWHDPTRLADPDQPGPATADDAARLAAALAEALDLDPGLVFAAYEDPLHVLLADAQQPDVPAPSSSSGSTPDAGAPDHPYGGVARPRDLAAQMRPGDPALASARSRWDLIEDLTDARGEPTGYVLPLEWDHSGEGGRWASGPWWFRRGSCFLVPGDSPLGLRLPLAAEPWVPAPDPRAADREPEPSPRHALAVEPRLGQLRVFLPPAPDADAWLALVGRVENAAAGLGVQVVVEGYAPPDDPGLQRLSVTPDPGVIEVNVHPAASWPEQVAITTTVYEQARLARLSTETFDLDGYHTGTGGGNHLTLGGRRPADSPLLRRPDLLRSLITYWQHHPALSYLFSGRFVGPTSQAPRVDEARHDALYELEIAFDQLDQLTDGEDGEPLEARLWLVDRLLRHLLVDVTGNTHRAEFCIDKLYSPDSERGRLGLVELRAFEMPPHPQMALVQSLLVRALVARFWERPYRHPLIRWGTALHDRYLLHHWVASDIAEVVRELGVAGFDVDRSWLDPFLEFRFPLLGSVEVHGVGIELRSAIEPWYTLGEESAANATARYVDSSVERLQVKVQRHLPERFDLTANGVRVPLQPTGVSGEYVAGVRYRAWQPPSALHPTIPVQAPVVIDLLDRWNDRSLGGCSYHVSHRGGLAYETFPVNANEAQARRSNRFEPFGSTTVREPSEGGGMPAAGGDPEYPGTLDLRRHHRPGV